MNKQYHLFFKEIPEEVLQLVRTTIKSGLFKKDKSQEFKIELLNKLMADLNNYYQVENTTLILDPLFLGVGGYSYERKIIIINKPSLVTFLHEYYHHLQHCLNYPIDEESARGYSHSVYHQATPKLFANAVRKGLLIFQSTIEGENQNV